MARRPRIAAFLTAALASVSLAAASPSSADTSETAAPRAAAAKVAREIKQLTGAYESTVRGCQLKTTHSALCRVRARYRDGLRICITDVPVKYLGDPRRRPLAEIGDTRCW